MGGLEASGREEQRMCKQITPRKIFGVLQVGVVCGVLLVYGGNIAMTNAENMRDGLAMFNMFMIIFTPFLFVSIVVAAWVLSRNAYAEAVLLKLRDSIAGDESLSSGMQRLGRFFPRFYVDMVRAGEETGKLPSV